MWLADLVLRQGHLSERAIVDAIMTGDRPAHLDRCDICAERALELGHWLESVRSVAVNAADEAFPAERLSAQQAQIMRRLEQLDEPARVIAFPRASVARMPHDRRRVAPAWVGVAAAAGLVVGAIGGQLSARMHEAPMPQVPAATLVVQPVDAVSDLPHSSLVDLDLETYMPEPLGAMNDMTPRVISTAAVFR
jgi:hypothetical protein